MIQYVLWDFNGTLADDLDAAIASVTDILARRGQAPMTRERYYELMEVPISRYYAKLFDLSQTPMEVIMPEFQEGYARHFAEGVRLAAGAEQALHRFQEAGAKQLILSSFRRDRIEEILRKFGILYYFEQILAAEDDRCEEKISRAERWFRASGATPETVLVIGDLVHDYEVAAALGARCALVCCGHQHRRDLERTGAAVYTDITELREKINI